MFNVLKASLFAAIFCGVLVACGLGDDAAKNASVGEKTAKAHNSAETLFNQSCVSCHLSGVAGAPKKGDVATWQQKLDEQGIDELVASVRNGVGAMPPMGMCSHCSDDDFKRIIEWMAAPK